MTIKENAFIGKAGIDRSNADGKVLLLPKNPQLTAKKIYGLIVKKQNIKRFGVIITDSRSLPLRAGAMGLAIGFWGFSPLKSYVGKKDVFGRELLFETTNVVDSLATAAVLVMGEGSEQTPVVTMEDVNFIEFNEKKPSRKELKEFYLTLENDYFHQLYENIFD